ncbi:MAG: prepilin-type N-terminal cleavage/methylation domain-containing protein [Pyrinomonadaceae bacterium]
MTNKIGRAKDGERRTQAGFTLIETVIAMLVLTFGLLAVAGAISYSISASYMSRNVTSAKLIVASILEQMQTLRNTQQLAFKQIANTGAVDNTGLTTSFTGFSTDFNPVSSSPGPDGVFGTCDDISTAKGADNKWCTGDDTKDQTLLRPGYEYRIVITTFATTPNLKKIEVTIRYAGQNGATYELVGVSYLNNNSGTNHVN